MPMIKSVYTLDQAPILRIMYSFQNERQGALQYVLPNGSNAYWRNTNAYHDDAILGPF